MEDYETFSEEQRATLAHYVTNTAGSIFALRNLPEVIKGALFSRYSRSALGLRTLLLKEFILGEETAFSAIAAGGNVSENPEDQVVAIKKAQNFYDRILDGYGDDSIGELGGAHLAIENISMLAAKVVEDNRMGGSPLEKSTRYIYFDQKVGERYLYYREPVIMTSAFRDEYLATCDHLFETYSQLIGQLTPLMEQRFPKEQEISKAAYSASIRAKVLDCLRGLLPAGTLTNMGLYGNGRFFEYLLHKLQCQNLAELVDIGKSSFNELSKVIPSFIRRAEHTHRHHATFMQFHEAMGSGFKKLAEQYPIEDAARSVPGVKLITADPDAAQRVVAALFYNHGHASFENIERKVAMLSQEELAKIFDVIASARTNRRHKSPRALEHTSFTFEFLADFGIYRDLHRHRLLTQERQWLTCRYGYFIPDEILDTPMERPYREAMERARATYERIAVELPEEAQYVVPMAYHVRWYFHVNLRELEWICELRSQPQGHPSYRFVAQEMARQVIERVPLFESFFKFVDYEGYSLGRLSQEQRKAQRQPSV